MKNNSIKIKKNHFCILFFSSIFPKLLATEFTNTMNLGSVHGLHIAFGIPNDKQL